MVQSSEKSAAEDEQHKKYRSCGAAEKRQFPRHDEHYYQNAYNGYNIRYDIRQTVDKEPIDVIGVPCHALHERTRLFGRIEADGQSLHGGENLDFYIIYDSRHYTAHKELERHGHKQSQKLHADNCADKISERDEQLLRGR